MDLNHGASFVPPVAIYAAGYEGCAGADVVVITAGAKQQPGESRLDLAQRNAGILSVALVRIVAAILRDENSVLPISTLVHDYYGIRGINL
jgi:L-lactate dehydrogenase